MRRGRYGRRHRASRDGWCTRWPERSASSDAGPGAASSPDEPGMSERTVPDTEFSTPPRTGLLEAARPAETARPARRSPRARKGCRGSRGFGPRSGMSAISPDSPSPGGEIKVGRSGWRAPGSAPARPSIRALPASQPGRPLKAILCSPQSLNRAVEVARGHDERPFSERWGRNPGGDSAPFGWYGELKNGPGPTLPANPGKAARRI